MIHESALTLPVFALLSVPFRGGDVCLRVWREISDLVFALGLDVGNDARDAGCPNFQRSLKGSKV